MNEGRISTTVDIGHWPFSKSMKQQEHRLLQYTSASHCKWNITIMFHKNNKNNKLFL